MTKYEVELDDTQLEAAKQVLPGVEFKPVEQAKKEEVKPEEAEKEGEA